VRDQCAAFGDIFDEWQDGAGRAVLAKRADGQYAATVGGVTLSIPRQVAKTFLVGRIIFALCVLFPGLRVIWTAHRSRTSTNSFRALVAYTRRKKVAVHIEHVRSTNGEQEIAFKNGSIIMFGAREQGFGRGFDEVDVVVFDEAQILTEKALEDIVPATNQSRHPHGALIFFMGTPPRPTDPGEAFTLRRDKALAGRMTDGLYIECSADEDADIDDRKQWAKANPSYPAHTPEVAMLRMRENLGDDDSFRREALGIWDAAKSTSDGLDVERWSAGARPGAARGKRVVFGVDVGGDRMAHIAVAWNVGARVHVQLTDENGVPPLKTVARLSQLTKDWKGPVMLGGTSSQLEVPRARVVSASEFAAAVGRVVDLNSEGLLTHGNQPLLNAAAVAARLRPFGTAGERTLVLQGAPDVGPLAAVVRAVAGLQAAAKRSAPAKPVVERRSLRGSERTPSEDLAVLQF
jgi:hypothetical protein